MRWGMRGGDRLALAFVVGMRGHHERWWGWDEGGEMVGMRGHHIFLLRHIMTAEKRVMAVAVVMAMA